MDTQVLTEKLRDMDPAEYIWTFSQYSSRKSKEGYILEFSNCEMENITEWISALKEYLLVKPVAERVVEPYSPFLPIKETIGAMELSNEQINEQFTNILASVKNTETYPPEDFLSGILPTTAGYVFYGEKCDEGGNLSDRVLFLRRTNPLINSSKALLCTPDGKKVVCTGEPVFKFTQSVDILFIGEVCYFFSYACEKDLNMESRYIAICENRMKDIAEASIINNYDKFESIAMSGKNSRKFADFDNNILNYIAKLPILERAEFLENHGILIDGEGRMETDDPEQCELIIDLLCCRSCHDALGRLSVGSNITPR